MKCAQFFIMNENYPSVAKHVAEKPSSPIFDSMIDDVLAKYEDDRNMTNAAREKYDSNDRGDKVDEACWDYCSTGIPEEMGKAVNLRSLYAVRSIDVASSSVVAGSEWKYYVPVLNNPFWLGVDQAIQAYLRKYADARVSSEVVESISDDSRHIVGEQIVANVNDHDVLRRTNRHTCQDEPYSVEYVVVPNTKKN
jgi:hypothetical protein